ncbi:MAG: hypothetical protein OIF48_04195 [Silicimonas sp.]|nr:hypothetical protein [Silicimonas sp.]
MSETLDTPRNDRWKLGQKQSGGAGLVAVFLPPLALAGIATLVFGGSLLGWAIVAIFPMMLWYLIGAVTDHLFPSDGDAQ